VCREASIRGQRNRPLGSGTAKHSALLDAVLCAVHAGGEQGWKSGHLEPLLFCPAGFLLVTSPIVLPDWKHSLAAGAGSAGVSANWHADATSISSAEEEVSTGGQAG
jgi:hypothetical protein